MTDWNAEIREYLNLREVLGAKLQGKEKRLREFAGYLRERGETHVSVQVALQWASSPDGSSPTLPARRLADVRIFSRYLHSKDSRHEVLPPDLLPLRSRRIPPYIYSEDDISRLVQAARELPSRRGFVWLGEPRLRGRTHATAIGLIAATGLRGREVTNLDRGDVQLDDGVLVIRETKFGKTRLVPIHSTTGQALAAYAMERDRFIPRPSTEAFFLSEPGNRLSGSSLTHTFTDLVRSLGIGHPGLPRQPRLHDLRHTFAVRTLLHWYRQDIDAERHLPDLSTYLGHVHAHGTYWYLEAVPELLEHAARRMRRRGERS